MLNDSEDLLPADDGSPSSTHPLRQAKSFSFGRSMIPPPTLGGPLPVQVIERVGTPNFASHERSSPRSSLDIGGVASITTAASSLLPIALLGRRRASKDTDTSAEPTEERLQGRLHSSPSPTCSPRPNIDGTNDMSISSPAAAFAAKFGAARSSASTGRPTSAGNAAGQTSNPRSFPATATPDGSFRGSSSNDQADSNASPIEPSASTLPSSKSRLGFGFTRRSRRAREAAQARSDTPSSSDDVTEEYGQEHSADSIDPRRYEERYGDRQLAQALDGYRLEPSGSELRAREALPRWDSQDSPASSSKGGWPKLRSKSSSGPLPAASLSTSTSSRHGISKVSVAPSSLPPIPPQQEAAQGRSVYDEGITPTRSTMDDEADAFFKTPTGARTVRSGSTGRGKQRPELHLAMDGMSRSASMPLSPGSSAVEDGRIVLGPALPARSAARAAAKENVEMLNLTMKTRPAPDQSPDPSAVESRQKPAASRTDAIPDMIAVPARKSSRSLRLNSTGDGSQDQTRPRFPGDASTADEMPLPPGSRERSRNSSRTDALRETDASATNSDSPAIEGHSRDKSRSRHQRDKSQGRIDVGGGASSSTRHRPQKDKGARTLALPNALDIVPSMMGLYVYQQPQSGRAPDRPLRAHSGTLVGDKIYVIGGSDKSGCWPGVATFDTETYMWETLETRGEIRRPLRAHTTTLVDQTLYVFGGGDGPDYTNEVWAFDTSEHRSRLQLIFLADIFIQPPTNGGDLK